MYPKPELDGVNAGGPSISSQGDCPNVGKDPRLRAAKKSRSGSNFFFMAVSSYFAAEMERTEQEA
jgi:hypothetical protein